MSAFIILAIGMIPLLISCSSPPSEIATALGQEAVLAPGQTVYVTGESLKVRFKEVVNDSRCPQGVTCIWAGQVSSLVQVTLANATSDMVLTQPGLGQAGANFNDYDIAFGVDPYPQAGKQIQKQDYRLRLTIQKKTALSGGILTTFQVIDR